MAAQALRRWRLLADNVSRILLWNNVWHSASRQDIPAGRRCLSKKSFKIQKNGIMREKWDEEI